MILRKSSLLPLLAVSPPASGYFAQVNNAHVEFAATGAIGDADAAASAAETVDDRSAMQHNTSPSLWKALENALEQKSELGYAAPKIMGDFEEWVEEFGREYENLEEKGRRMLVWLENHGEF